MKKLKVILGNIICVILLFMLLEFIAYSSQLPFSYKYLGNGRSFIQFLPRFYSNYFRNEFQNFNDEYKHIQFRETCGSEYNDKKSIVIFGCSFAFGDGLEQEQTLHYLLSKQLKRMVWNRAFIGWGPQNMLYQLKNDEFYKTIYVEPEAIIYVSFIGQSRRIFHETFLPNAQVFYKYTKNGLKQSLFSSGTFGYGYLARSLRRAYTDKFVSDKQREEAIINHFLDAKKEINKHWQDTKLYVLLYTYDLVEEKAFEKLENYGFHIIKADKLINKDLLSLEYQISEYDAHPNAKAWELIVPELCKVLNIK